MFYLIVIVLANLLIVALNFAFGGDFSALALGRLIFSSLLATAAAFAIDGVLALLIRRLLPEKLFPPDSRLFHVSEGERRLWRKLGINSWKNKVPEWGGFTGFHKDRLGDVHSSAYLARFLSESHYGVAIHLVSALLGYAILFLPYAGTLSIGLPVAIVNMILNLLPTMILRFNTPPLLRLYKRSLSKESQALRANQP